MQKLFFRFQLPFKWLIGAILPNVQKLLYLLASPTLPPFYTAKESEAWRYLVQSPSSVHYRERKTKDPEVLIDPYVLNERKLKEGVIALWLSMKHGQIYRCIRTSVTFQDSLQKKI